LLPSFIYSVIAVGHYEKLKRWTKKIPASATQWVFGVCMNGHWVALRVDWETMSIGWYDPNLDPLHAVPTEPVDKVLKASSNTLLS
jgi:Ulp1 family protease